MNNPFIGQVTLFAGNFPPRAFAFCQGQLLPISSNTALFSILGTIYGGDGRTTFALPDLRGRCAIHPGRGPGLSSYVLGERQGIESVNLNLLNLPSHSHLTTNDPATDQHILLSSVEASETAPSISGDVPAAAVIDTIGGDNVKRFGPATATVNGQPLSGSAGLTLQNTGGSQSHENRRPFIAINYIIALQGTYPSRS